MASINEAASREIFLITGAFKIRIHSRSLAIPEFCVCLIFLIARLFPGASFRLLKFQ